MPSFQSLNNMMSPIPPSAIQKSPILELPDELILFVAGYLAPTEQCLLSHTCRTMRRLISRDWNEYVQSLELDERNNFLIELAYAMPHHWACESCGRLHHVDERDVPSKRRLPPCVQPTIVGIRLWAGYHLEYHHIQLALKLHRQEPNSKHLERIMATHRYAESEQATAMAYVARPKIVGGHFFLHEQIYVGNRFSPFRSSSAAQSQIALCPHQSVVNRPLDYQRLQGWFLSGTELSGSMYQAIREPGRKMYGHCRWCLTDYSVIYRELHTQLVVEAWHDFGAYGSISNIHWSSQARRQNGHFDQFSLMIAREPGRLRTAYLHGF
ncbi:hypothetical protein ACQKWADRAFT_329319 [Trichoderma austrokoningii]